MEGRHYLGIDIDDEYAVVSVFGSDLPDPVTISTVAGSERFQIPMLVARNPKTGAWVIGEEARRLVFMPPAVTAQDGAEQAFSAPYEAEMNQPDCVAGNLLSAALAREIITIGGARYGADELLTLFLKRVLAMARGTGRLPVTDRVIVSMDAPSSKSARLFATVAAKLGIGEGKLSVIDRKEAFYYFAYSQKEELWLHDVVLCDCRRDEVRLRRLERDLHTTPQLVTISEEEEVLPRLEAMELAADRDAVFLEFLEKCMAGHIVSAVYLTGNGFDGDWMRRSLSFLCRGRHVFIGRNLYSKGACHACAVRESWTKWRFVYMGDAAMKVNVSLKVRDGSSVRFYTLINAGENWYDTSGECEVLLDGVPEIDFWMQPPRSRQAKVEKLTLQDLPERPPKMTRLRISATPLSDSRVQVKLRDLGFGEFYPSSEKVWEYAMGI